MEKKKTYYIQNIHIAIEAEKMNEIGERPKRSKRDWDKSRWHAENMAFG